MVFSSTLNVIISLGFSLFPTAPFLMGEIRQTQKSSVELSVTVRCSEGDVIPSALPGRALLHCMRLALGYPFISCENHISVFIAGIFLAGQFVQVKLKSKIILKLPYKSGDGISLLENTHGLNEGIDLSAVLRLTVPDYEDH